MNSSGFFKKIREIIREEIEIALEKKVTKKEVFNNENSLSHQPL